jgi:hypothetical protein
MIEIGVVVICATSFETGRGQRARYREQTVAIGERRVDLDTAFALAAGLEDDEVLRSENPAKPC